MGILSSIIIGSLGIVVVGNICGVFWVRSETSGWAKMISS